MKNPVTLAGIEPATFRFVAQHLNHCATAVPQLLECITIIVQKQILWNPNIFHVIRTFITEGYICLSLQAHSLNINIDISQLTQCFIYLISRFYEFLVFHFCPAPYFGISSKAFQEEKAQGVIYLEIEFLVFNLVYISYACLCRYNVYNLLQYYTILSYVF